MLIETYIFVDISQHNNIVGRNKLHFQPIKFGHVDGAWCVELLHICTRCRRRPLFRCTRHVFRYLLPLLLRRRFVPAQIFPRFHTAKSFYWYLGLCNYLKNKKYIKTYINSFHITSELFYLKVLLLIVFNFILPIPIVLNKLKHFSLYILLHLIKQNMC